MNFSGIFRWREQLILVLMLELLHFSLWAEIQGPLSRAMLLMHLGFFLIWQPLWRGDERLRWFDILLIGLITYSFVFWLEWWLLFAWVMLLIGLAGGRVIINRLERNIYLLALTFLVIEILIRCTPMAFGVSVSAGTLELVEILLPLLPLAILLLPVEDQDRRFQTVDFIHAISISTLTGLLVAGTLLNMYRTQTDYLVALIETLIVIGGFLLAISWLLIPRAGFSGLSQMWLRSMLNIGTPFEAWLGELSFLFKQKSSPEGFLASAMEELTELPWIEGVEWSTGGPVSMTGRRAKNRTEIEVDRLRICIFSFTPVSGALYYHCKLLVQLVNNFYVAKLREKELSQQIHLQAVYETGARITHDIKNLLQSLQAITSIIQSDNEQDNFPVSAKLLKKQLPALSQRLKLALEKLQAPDSSAKELVYARDWWQDFRSRANLENIHVSADLPEDPVIPGELFDSVVDNLLDNIRQKPQVDTLIHISIRLNTGAGDIRLTVCDTGGKIPEDIAKSLLKEPVKSDQGLGIGLYQAARLAESKGYELRLINNENRKVCFELAAQTGD